ncbi:hypothetical protein F5879DRAFT_994178 [Lentinula edodes]|nr:hypothetical protein F5879DRAFT_994178 [Lentinula edodes]
MTISLAESETLRHVHIPHISGLISKKNPAVQETSFNHGTDNIRIRRLEVTNQSRMQTEKVQNLQVDSLSNISEATLQAKFFKYKNQKLNEISAVIEQFRSDGQHIAKLVDEVNVYLRERQTSHKELFNKTSSDVNNRVNLLNEKLSELGQRLSVVDYVQLIGHPNERTSALWRTTRHLDDIWTSALRLIPISRESQTQIVAEFEEELKHLDWITNGSPLEMSLAVPLLKSIRTMTPLIPKVFPLTTSFYSESCSNSNRDFDDNESSVQSCDDLDHSTHAFGDGSSGPNASSSRNFQEVTVRTLEDELSCCTGRSRRVSQEATLPVVKENLLPAFGENIHVFDRVWCLIVRVTRQLMTFAWINYCGILAWQLSIMHCWFQRSRTYLSNAAGIFAWYTISWFQATFSKIEILGSVHDFVHSSDVKCIWSQTVFPRVIATCIFTTRTPVGSESEPLVLTSNPSSSLASFGFVYHLSTILDIITNRCLD